MTIQTNGIGRRQVLKQSLVGGGALLGFPTIVPASALGASGATAPSERIHLGFIGVGRMGSIVHLPAFLQQPDLRVVAVCDVLEGARRQAKAKIDATYGDQVCAMYNDFRELLARDDIDAVLIASPEHWHAMHTVAAARRGIHMYCEKPLCLTVAQAQAVRAVVRHYGVVFQLGTQQRSGRNYRFSCELVRNGRIGRLEKIVVGQAVGDPSRMVQEKPQNPPAGMDWDLFLGPAPSAPYSEQRAPVGRWMHIYDYGIGMMGGYFGIHDIDIAQWMNDADHTTPVKVEGTGVFYRDMRDTICQYEVEYRYANGVRFEFMDAPTARKRYPQFHHAVNYGVLMLGTEGWIFVSREGMATHPESLMRAVIGPNEKHVVNSTDHRRNFLDAVRTGQPVVSPVEAAAHDEMVCQMADIAIRLQRPLRWDPEEEHFLDDAQANRMLSRPMRSPWRLDVPELIAGAETKHS